MSEPTRQPSPSDNGPVNFGFPAPTMGTGTTGFVLLPLVSRLMSLLLYLVLVDLLLLLTHPLLREGNVTSKN
ncbi:MAG: hypothetical protein EXX96DRAFT_562769 [Benjaminiella poitrasii]|nr:MAG: hypothetical protein EXX96DRAFT_562769 [Benjaminiella poitrasii]